MYGSETVLNASAASLPFGRRGLLHAGRRRWQQRDDRVKDAVAAQSGGWRRSRGPGSVRRCGPPGASTACSCDRLTRPRLRGSKLIRSSSSSQIASTSASRCISTVSCASSGTSDAAVVATQMRLPVEQIDHAAEAALPADRASSAARRSCRTAHAAGPAHGRSPRSHGPAC